MRGTRAGLGAAEILVVVAIFGVLAAIGIPSYAGAIRQAELRAAANELASELRRARSLAQRDNLNVAVTLTGGAGIAVRLGNGPEQRRTLQHPVNVTATSGGTSVVYTAPFGEIGGPLSWQVGSPPGGRQGAPLRVNVAGVTGRVSVTGGN